MLKLLDLFCCAGGAGMGYHRAGFDVTGVDINPQPNYPSIARVTDGRHTVSPGMRFIQGDALEYLAAHGNEYDVIHASPPCQASSALTKGTNRITKSANHVDMIPETRALLDSVGVPYVIENVQGSQLRRDLTLCGEIFGLAVIRHRYFEFADGIAQRIAQPTHKPHRGRVAGYRHGEWFDGPYFAVYGDGGGKGTVAQWQKAMGIDWTNSRRELAEAIPPAYTLHIGQQLRQMFA